MSTLTRFEEAMADLVAEQTTGDDTRFPIVGYVVYVVSTDPETMRTEEPFWIIPEGQTTYHTRGMIEAARDELMADNQASIAYAEWSDDDDD